MKKVGLSAVFLYKAQDAGLKLTTLNFQSAILLVQRVSPQIHHAGGCRRDSESKEEQKRGDLVLDSGQLLEQRMVRRNAFHLRKMQMASIFIINWLKEEKQTSCQLLPLSFPDSSDLHIYTEDPILS